MAKKSSKKKRKSLPELVEKRKMVQSKGKLNPFEFKINREKHPILGRKTMKGTKGKPGISRSKAISKRKETLLKEYMERNNANKFVDRRIGEYDATMSVEDKMTARFTAERKTQHEKVDRFSLNDGEELTHFGQSLSEIEKFDDPRSDSDDEDQLGANFLKTMNFGGFLTKKDPSGENEQSEFGKSRKQMIEDMIKASKLRKHERQANKEETEEMTEKIDTEWKEVRSLVTSLVNPSVSSEGKKDVDDYDVVVRELKFEARAKASDRLKTAEEIAKEEKERLEKLEADRLRRMKGIFEAVDKSHCSKTVGNHKSADDLDDESFAKEDDRFSLEYKDGVAVQTAERRHKKKVSFEDQKASECEVEESSDEGEACLVDEKEGDGDDASDGSDNEEEKEEDDDDDGDDSYSDMESNESDSESDVKRIDDKNEVEKAGSDTSDIETVLKKRKIMMDTARKELPYTFSAPASYEEFLKLVENHCVGDQLVIIERLIKCHHPSLDSGNLVKLELLFAILLQWINELSALEEPSLDAIDGLVPVLYDLAKFSPKHAACSVTSVIMEKQSDFQKRCDRQSTGRTAFPELDTIIFLKLVPVLFPSSDFAHDVVTPSLLFLGQLLTQCKVANGRDVFVGLFVCNLFHQCVSLSRRFVPEAINFLLGCFLSALNQNDNNFDGRPFVHPFKPVGPSADLLLVRENLTSNFQYSRVPVQRLRRNDAITDEIRVSALHICISLLHRFAELYTNLPSFPIIFNPVLEHYSLLPLDKLPTETTKLITEFVDFLKEKVSGFDLSPLAQEKKKPQPYVQFEPRIEERFDGKRHRKGNPTIVEKQRLVHKYKREMKGAIREIRRDNQFLSQHQFTEQQERDAERKRKLKRIYHDLATQEGFCRKLERKKKFKK